MLDDLPIVEFAFPGPLREQLVAAIERGEKTATSSLLREYEVDDQALPAVGDRGAVVDSEGERRFAIETTHVEVLPLHAVPLEHALAEGEGYRSVAEWRAGHLRFWGSEQLQAELGGRFVVDDDTPIVLERFVRLR